MTTNPTSKTVKASSLDADYSELWRKLSESKEYRERFVESFVKRAFALQLRTLRKQRWKTQGEFAQASNIEQGVISRAENPDYGNLSFKTVFRVVAGYDLAFIPKVVTFGEFAEWVKEVSEGIPELPSFEEENRERTIAPLSAISASLQKGPMVTEEEKSEGEEQGEAQNKALGGSVAKEWKSVSPAVAAQSGASNAIVFRSLS